MLGCSCKSQPLVISNDISHVGKRMQGLIRAPLLFSTAAKVPSRTSEATVKVMSGADAVRITKGWGGWVGGGTHGRHTCGVGCARRCPHGEAPLTWLLMNQSFFFWINHGQRLATAPDCHHDESLHFV